MNRLICDLFPLALICLLIYETIPVRPLSQWTDSPLSGETGKALRGFFAMLILLHHLSQQMQGIFLIPLFRHLGYLAAGFFFFLSGYGLQKQHILKPHYADFFLQRRLPAVILPYAVFTAAYWYLYYRMGNVYRTIDILHSFVNGDPIVLYSWYILVILQFYIVFWVLMLLFRKRQKLMVLGAAVWYVCFVFGCHALEYSEWWYSTCILLIPGMAYAVWEYEINRWLRSHYICCLAVCSLLFAGLFVCSSVISQAVPVLRFPLTSLRVFLFIALLVLLLQKIRFRNRILSFFGSFSQEIYLCQGFWILLLRDELYYIENDVLACALILGATLLSSWLMHHVFTVLLKQIRP